MELDRTKQLIHEGIDRTRPIESLIHVLEASIELLSLPDNDFAWSRWKSQQEAVADFEKLIHTLQSGGLPERLDVAILFGPTGSLQEGSLSSGWGEPFLMVGRVQREQLFELVDDQQHLFAAFPPT